MTSVGTKQEERCIDEITKKVMMDIDSGADTTVWPMEWFPEIPTEATEESRRAVKFWSAGDTTHPTIQVAGRKNIPLRICGEDFSMNVTAAGVRKPLISLGDMGVSH